MPKMQQKQKPNKKFIVVNNTIKLYTTYKVAKVVSLMKKLMSILLIIMMSLSG